MTQAGCGALCPAYDRGCYGCFGPMESPNTASLGALLAAARAATDADLVRAFRTLQRLVAPAFRTASDAYERTQAAVATIKVDALARVEGEGGLTVKLSGGTVDRRQAPHLRAAALLRGLPARAALPEAPDITARICGICPVAYQMSAVHAMEARLRRHGRRAAARAAPAALLRRVDREPRAARLHAARPGLPRLRERHPHGRATTPRSCSRRCG